MRKQGLFRVVPSDQKVRELELYLSQGCYVKLRDADPHVVASYLKRVLNEMKEPLISLQYLDQFAQLSSYASTSE